MSTSCPHTDQLEPKRRAYSYLRFSTPEQRQGDSTRRQTEMAERYAAARGLELDEELSFHDLGVSAFRGRNAETGGLAAFLEAIQSGLVERGSVLLVENLDRLSRDAIVEAQSLFLNIITSGIELVTLNDGRSYSRETVNQSPMDMMYAILGFIRANEESATKSRRLQASWEAKRAEAGSKPMTSCAPAWLRLQDGEWEVIEDRAEVVRSLFDWTLQGVGQNALAKRLNEQGEPTWGKAAWWGRSYVLKILTNPAAKGVLTTHRLSYEGDKRRREPVEEIEGYYPAVVDQETWGRVQAMHRRAPGSQTPSRSVLAGGLAKCSDCGSTMILVNKGGRSKGPRLVCGRGKAGAGCSYRSVLYSRVEKALVDRIGWAAAEAPAGRADLDDQFEEIDKQTAGAEDAVERLSAAVAEQGLSRALSERLRAAEAELEDLRRRRRGLELQASIGAPGAVQKRLARLVAALTSSSLDVGQANLALRQAVSRVVVDPDEGTLSIEWQHGGSSTLTFGMPTPGVKSGL